MIVNPTFQKMFENDDLQKLINSEKDCIISTPCKKYALYKIHRDDKIEISLMERFTREKNRELHYLDTILRFWVRKEQDLGDILYIMLRNCLLVEKKRCFGKYLIQ